MGSREKFSRKELSGWGDSGQIYGLQLNIDELSNIIDPKLEKLHGGTLKEIVDIMLEALHLEDQIIVQRKYNAEKEDIVYVTQYMKFILFRRAVKKLSSLIEIVEETVEKEVLDQVVRDLQDYIIFHFSDVLFKTFKYKIDMLVNNYSNKLPGFVKSSEIDDLNSIAIMEFIQAIRSWDPLTNPVVWPFAYSRINGAMRDHLRHLTKADPSRIFNWVNDAASVYLTVNKNTQEFAGSIEDGITLKEAMQELSATEQKIVTLKSLKDMTLVDIGKQIDLSESQVSRLYNRALGKLKRILIKQSKADE